MKPLIPFIAQPDFEQLEAWLEVLGKAMPDAHIADFRALPANHRADVSVAIVANPDPSDVLLFPNLRWVHSVWAGVERLLAGLANTATPIVRLVDPRLADTMAEAVLAWTLYLHRDMPGYAQQQRFARWHQRPYVAAGSRTVVLLGLGALGEAAAARLLGAGFRVCGWSRRPKSIAGVECHSGADLDAILSKADILVCLLPLTPQTCGILDATRLSAMQSGAQIINFSRGAIIDDDALRAGLDAAHIGHAVLDVFAVEPLPAKAWHWAHPRVTVLPHISAPTDPRSSARIVADNIGHWLATGIHPPAVDRATGY
jgi:glyoxylate/hydroxypyruvate reductase A